MNAGGRAALLLLCSLAPAFASDALQRGRDIFLFGAETRARVGRDGVEAPGTSFACKNCHGMGGTGRREGRTVFPPITWAALASATPNRPAFTRAQAILAIREGVGADGEPLDPIMPRYALSDADAEALMDYLDRLDSEQASGVSTEEVRFGVLAAGRYEPLGGELVRRLNAEFASLNARRGIYDRRVTAVELADARSAETDGVLAVVSLIAETPAEAKALAARGVPNLFSFTPVDGDEDPDLVRGVGASLADIAKASVRHMKGRGVQDIQLCAEPGAPLAEAVAREAGAASLHVAMRSLTDCSARAAPHMFVVPAQARLDFSQHPPGRSTIFGLLDDLAPWSEPLRKAGFSLSLANPRPRMLRLAAEQKVPLLDIQAQITARLIERTLEAVGRNLSRSRFVDAIDGVTLEEEGYPPLDYATNRTTGGKDVEIFDYAAE
ncbi:MAG: hypothetical protein DI629_05365 [Mesorhizobium amorphae]|nr:MAG: hypothetical protein DI629_05365 [Mesorhizobium amorphae]